MSAALLTSAPASRICSRLWQGGERALVAEVLQEFHVLVLCAKEIQPCGSYIPRHLKVIRCPLWDAEEPLGEAESNLVMHTARRCARGILRARRTLVTCQAGLNRSGLVTAVTLHLLTGRPGFECARIVQRKRPGALFNQQFLRELNELF